MTFDLTPSQQTLLDRIKAVAATADAAAIDLTGAIPDALRAAAAAAVDGLGAVDLALAVEELAAACAGLAVAAGVGGAGGDAPWPGLRGAGAGLAHGAGTTDRSRVVLSATAVGVGRAAVAHAVAAMKAVGLRPGGDETTPHWTLADGATEVDAARLVTLEAAQQIDARDAAAAGTAELAWRLARGAAQRAVDAAIKVAGPGAYARGSLLERLSRDAQTLVSL